MKPLMNASPLSGVPNRATAGPKAGVSSDLGLFGDQQLEPPRVVRRGVVPAPSSRAAPGPDESSNQEKSDALRLEPIRVTRDAGADMSGGRVHSRPPERVSAGKSPSFASSSPDWRHLHSGSGILRIAGIALPLIAIAGAVVGGGYVTWKTEFVRPALVEGISPDAFPVENLIPVHVASAAVQEDGELGVRTALRSEAPARVPAPRVLRVSQHGGTPIGQSIAGTSAAPGDDASEGKRTSQDSAGSLVSGRLEPVAQRGGRSPTYASSESTSGHASRNVPERRVRLLETDTSGPATPDFRPRTPTMPVASVDATGIAIAEPRQDQAERRSGVGAGIVIRKRIRPDYIAASLERAYRAFVSGDEASAEEAYRDVLAQEPGNRDARLGLAALAVRAARWNEAAGHYARVLESHPADTVARAALIGIDEQDPAQGERRLKTLLRSEPNAAHLHFDLGTLHAAQGRWPEAQRAFSDACRFDRSNADYVYNLAVSHEHLSRSESALRLYREALLLSRSRAVAFDTEVVLQRIGVLDSDTALEPMSGRTNTDAVNSAPAARVR